MDKPKIRVMLVDDHSLCRSGLKELLEHRGGMSVVTTTGEHDPDPPWPYRRIHLKYRLGGEGLTPKAVEQAITLSLEKYCSVAATVRGVAQITTEYEIIPAP